MKIKPIILKEAQEETQDYSKFLVDNKEVNEDLNDFVDGKIEHGYTLGISCFDEYYVAKKFEFCREER